MIMHCAKIYYHSNELLSVVRNDPYKAHLLMKRFEMYYLML
mgnify:CR=1 FL=1